MADCLPSGHGRVAQLGERKHGMFQVAGSIPVTSTNFHNRQLLERKTASWPELLILMVLVLV